MGHLGALLLLALKTAHLKASRERFALPLSGLIINYADPALAAGTAVLGLGLVVLPFLSKLNKLLDYSQS